MRAFFSEFSFGFAVTHELVTRVGRFRVGAPRFPSLVAEGREGGGYDVSLGIVGFPLFLQFKVSERMIRSTAREWDVFQDPYYRFKLHAPRHSDQHQLLLDLENDGNSVYYAAPEFHHAEVLNEAFINQSVIDSTAFFSPAAIGPLPDQEEHAVVFLENRPVGYLCSERKEVERAAKGQEILGEMERRTHQEQPRQFTEEFLRGFADDIREIVANRIRIEPAVLDEAIIEMDPLDQIAYLSHTFFDAEFMVYEAD